MCTSALPEARPRVLVADADPAVQRLLAQHLTSDGFSIDMCADGRAALDRIVARSFDLIVLDMMLDGLDGITLCRAIRHNATNRNAGVIVVGAASSESDKVLTLVSGADDYLAKPLSPVEFMARVSAIMRRCRSAQYGSPTRGRLERTDLTLDRSRRQALVRGEQVQLSKQEFELLYDLASSPGIVFTRNDLLTRHWDHVDGRGLRLVDPVISRLRRKIERDPGTPRLIVTIWGVGYTFRE